MFTLSHFLGDQLKNIKAEKIQRFVNESENASKTIRNHISLLMTMWDMVKAWEYAQHNPFPRGTNGRLLIKMPRVVKGEGYNFTIEETLAIINKAQGRWKTFFRILAETGMRPGELAGLRTIDVGPRTIRIAQSVWQQVVQTPKTENAVRMFAISASLAEEVRQLIAGSVPNSHGLLFVTGMRRGKRNPGG
jgi:integrase